MADKTIHDLTEDTAPTFDDLIETENDPGGTPASRKAKLVNVTGAVVNAQTGTTYTVLTGDYRKLVTFTNGSAIAVTLPQAGASFPANWFFWAQNRGAGAATITPTTSTIDGAASLVLNQNEGALIVSDGTNYFTMRGKQATIGGAPSGSAGGGLSGTYPNPSVKVSIGVACSDESTALTTGTAKATFRMPHAMTVTDVRATLTTAQASGSIFTVDINEGGTTILSTKLTIDNTEKTSTTAATPPVISDASLADDAEITVDIDQIGTSGAAGLKVWLIGTRA